MSHQITDMLWQDGVGRLDYKLPVGADLVDMQNIEDNADGLDPSVFDAVVARLQDYVEKPVVTVCWAGENRSGLASVILLVLRGMNVHEAIALVRLKVPPFTDNPYVFWNPGFVQQVVEWAESR